MGLKIRLLDDIGDIELTLHAPSDLNTGQQREIASVTFEQLPERRSIPGSGQVQQPDGFRALHVVASHPNGLSEILVTKSFDSCHEFFSGISVSTRIMNFGSAACQEGEDCGTE